MLFLNDLRMQISTLRFVVVIIYETSILSNRNRNFSTPACSYINWNIKVINGGRLRLVVNEGFQIGELKGWGVVFPPLMFLLIFPLERVIRLTWKILLVTKYFRFRSNRTACEMNDADDSWTNRMISGLSRAGQSWASQPKGTTLHGLFD